MVIYRIAVILWRWGEPGQLQDRSWYEEYFFNPVYGQAGYWLKQSDGDVILTGGVFDWVSDPEAQPDFSDRTVTADVVTFLMQYEHGADLTNYDSIVVVLGIPKGVKSDGGSTRVNTRYNSHHAVVASSGDPFDFVAHELGHGILGAAHSFTWNTAFQAIGESPGGYGHRHCIMSARVYGGNPEAEHDAPAPRGLLQEYQSIGPSLNGVTANARGWIHTHDVTLTPGFVGEFEIRSRQWMGRDPLQPPQGIHITKPNGNTYVVEFYESLDWDSGLPCPYLILTQDKGGLADFHYPESHSGTYLDSIRLEPAALTGPRAAINNEGSLGVMPMSYDPARHVLTVKVNASHLSSGPIAMAEALSSVSKVVGSGHVTFLPGERFCAIGEWPFDLAEVSQTLTIDATHPRVHPGSAAIWTIDAVPLTTDMDKLTLTKTVMIPDPKYLNVTSHETVEIGYKIESLGNGSRLTLTNRPQDYNYSIEVGVTLKTSVASGSASQTVDITGREIRLPPEFYEAWTECMASFLKKKLHESQSVVVFDPGQIHKVPSEFADELRHWLDGLSHILDRGDREEFERVAATLRYRLRLPQAKLHVLNRSESEKLPRVTEKTKLIPPAAEFSDFSKSE